MCFFCFKEMTREEFVKFIQEWYRPIFEKGAEETWFTWIIKKTSTREPVYIDYKSTEAKQ
jgi:Fe-S cluster biosynthesis and repair protein YggX